VEKEIPNTNEQENIQIDESSIESIRQHMRSQYYLINPMVFKVHVRVYKRKEVKNAYFLQKENSEYFRTMDIIVDYIKAELKKFRTDIKSDDQYLIIYPELEENEKYTKERNEGIEKFMNFVNSEKNRNKVYVKFEVIKVTEEGELEKVLFLEFVNLIFFAYNKQQIFSLYHLLTTYNNFFSYETLLNYELSLYTVERKSGRMMKVKEFLEDKNMKKISGSIDVLNYFLLEDKNTEDGKDKVS
jgi:hypothetical protein